MTHFIIFSVLIGIAFNIFLFFLDKKEQFVKAYNPQTDSYVHVPLFGFQSDTKWKVLMISGFVPFLNIAFLTLMLIDIVGYLRK